MEVQTKVPLSQFVDKKFVHKVRDENVHIYGMRRALPREIDIEVFEVHIPTFISSQEEDFLLHYYVKGKGVNGDEKYILRTIPFKISRIRAEKYLHDAEADQDDVAFLKEFYELDQKSDKYILNRSLVTEAEEAQILTVLDRKDLHITDQERYEIADILEKVPEVDKKLTFFANMDVNQDHYYFFEHPQEHVPGMVLVETARQFSMACAHVYGNVPLEDSIFMLTEMPCKFTSYVELNYPVKVRAVAEKVKANKQGYWSYYNLTFTFFQKTKEVATIGVEATITNSNIFKRLRIEKDKYDQLPRFIPLPGLEGNFSLRRGDERYLCNIIDLSQEGFLLNLDDDLFIQKENESFDFIIFFPKAGFVTGKAEIRWKVPNPGDTYMAGFEITHLGKTDKENLKEAIKLHCRLKESREIL